MPTRTIAVVLTLAATAPALAAGGAARPQGTWLGTYTVSRATAPTAIGISFSGGGAIVTLPAGYAARDSVPAFGSVDHVRLTLPGRPALVLDGRIDGTRFAGAVRQGGARGTFSLTPASALPASAALGLYRLGDGTTLGLLGNDTGTWALEVESGAYHQLYGTAPSWVVGAKFGVRRPEQGQLRVSGTTLVWGRKTGRRLPLRQLEVRFPGARGAVLAGTLTVPAGRGPFPAAVYVHGSGPSLRTESQYLAALLARRGIAFLAYDKRGNGQSTGRYPGEAATPPTIDVLSRDVAAAAAFLAAQPEIDPARVGLAGASQAGWIIPLAAVRAGARVHWALIESGPVVTTGESDLYASLVSHGDVPLTSPIDDILDQVRKTGPVGFDPVPSLRRLRIPILWLYGEVDRSQPTALDVPVLERLRTDTGADLTWRVFPKADHFLFELRTGLNSERPSSRGVAPQVAPAVDGWLRVHKLAA